MLHHTPPLRLGLYLFALLALWIAASARGGEPRSVSTIYADRKEQELKAYKRFHYLRSRDEYRQRRKSERLSERRQLAAMFISGQNRPETTSAFRATVQQLETSPAAAQVLQASVPRLGSEQFVATNRFRKILRSDGSLTHAPPVLVCHSRDSSLSAAQVRMEDIWRQTLQRIGADAPISQQHIAALRHTLDNWKQRAASNFSQADYFGRLRGQEYLKSVETLITAVEDPTRREQLQSYYHGSGMAFDGGTVADLVHHVLSKELSTRPGSRAQLVLSELGHDLLRGLDGEIQLADQRVEYFKVQNDESSLDPALYGSRLPQPSDNPTPGSVPTSVDRLTQILGVPDHPAAPRPNVAQHVAWQK